MYSIGRYYPLLKYVYKPGSICFNPSDIHREYNVLHLQTDMLLKTQSQIGLRVQPVNSALPSPPAFIRLLHLLQWEHRCLYLLLHNMLGTTPAEAPACLAVGFSSLRFCFTTYQQKLGDNRLKLLLNFHIIILLNDSFIHLFIIELN